MSKEEQGQKSLVQRLRLNVGTAAAKAALPIAKRLQAGLNVEVVGDQTYELRLAICDGCEHLTEDNHCGRCFCPVEYKAKLAYNPYAASVGIKSKVTCPEGKW